MVETKMLVRENLNRRPNGVVLTGTIVPVNMLGLPNIFQPSFINVTIVPLIFVNLQSQQKSGLSEDQDKPTPYLTSAQPGRRFVENSNEEQWE